MIKVMIKLMIELIYSPFLFLFLLPSSLSVPFPPNLSPPHFPPLSSRTLHPTHSPLILFNNPSLILHSFRSSEFIIIHDLIPRVNSVGGETSSPICINESGVIVGTLKGKKKTKANRMKKNS